MVIEISMNDQNFAAKINEIVDISTLDMIEMGPDMHDALESGLSSSSAQETCNGYIPLDRMSRSASIQSCRSSSDPTILGKSSPGATILFNRFESEPITVHEKTSARNLHMQSPKSEKRNSRRHAIVRLIHHIAGLRLQTALSENIVAGVEETFYCEICLENCAKSSAFSAEGCPLHHEYCDTCMRGYTKAQVDDGAIEHTCPGMQQCRGVLTANDLRQLLSDESFARYERLKLVKTSPNYRECPQCNMGVVALESVTTSPELVCGSCGCRYCFFHSNAHPGLSCEDYSRRLSRRTKQEIWASESLVSRTTRPCPSCHVATEKNGGCNHM